MKVRKKEYSVVPIVTFYFLKRIYGVKTRGLNTECDCQKTITDSNRSSTQP